MQLDPKNKEHLDIITRHKLSKGNTWWMCMDPACHKKHPFNPMTRKPRV